MLCQVPEPCLTSAGVRSHYSCALDAVDLRRLVLEPLERIRELHLAAVLDLEEPEGAAAQQRSMVSVCARSRRMGRQASRRPVCSKQTQNRKDAIMISAGCRSRCARGGCGGTALLDELEQHNGTATCPDREAREHREAPLGVAFEAPPRHVVGLGWRQRSDGVGMVVWPGADPAREASAARGEAGP